MKKPTHLDQASCKSNAHINAGLVPWDMGGPRSPLWFDSVDLVDRPIRTCSECGRRLALGPANDEDEGAALSLIATEIVSGDAEMTNLHFRGFYDYIGHCEWDPLFWSPTFWVGYLAAAMIMDNVAAQYGDTK